MKTKFAYIQTWSTPPIAERVAKMLETHFPEFRMDVLTIAEAVKERKLITALNAYKTLQTYGWDLIIDRKKLKKYFTYIPYFYHWVKRYVAHCVNPDEYAFTFQLQSLYDASVPGIPHFIYTDHTHLANLDYQDFPWKWLADEEWVALEKNIYRNAARVFTRSSNINLSLFEQYHFPKERVSCVYVGGNVPHYPATDWEHDYGDQEVLFVGVDWERKGGPELLSAFQNIQPEFPHANLTIIGCQPSIRQKQVSVLGKLPLVDLPEHYKRATIFCLPTKWEPFGVVFVEALSFGIPIIATRTGAIPDFVQGGRNGFLVQPGDTVSLTSALRLLLENQHLRRRMGQLGRQLAAEKYNWDSVGQSIRRAVLSDIGFTNPPQ